MKKVQSRRLAGVSLAVMAGGLAATFPFHTTSAVGLLLHGGFEAGLVGGLADWFAVTALFRHPLGIPIPHTRLLPRNRGKVTDALVSMIETHLLNKESIEARIASFHLTSKALDIAAAEIQRAEVQAAISGVLKDAVRSFSWEPYLPWMQDELASLAAGVDPKPLLTIAADEILNSRHDETALDFMLGKAEQWVLLEETRKLFGNMSIRAIERIELQGMMAFAVNAFLGFVNEDKLGSILQNLLLSNIESLRTEGHPNREKLLGAIRREVDAMRDSEGLLAALEGWKAKLIGALLTPERLTSVLGGLQSKLLEALEQPDFVARYIVPLVSRYIDKLRGDDAALAASDRWVRGKIMHYVEENHSLIGRLVRENVDKLDDETLIAMIEDKAGNDLQWIRVNGAICGFLIGVVIEGVRLLIV
ncbi:DUF445 domain-containing protein [Paenibacillus mucilaginosus]|uniref:DUF445 domain-containing protein n=2 Tax=Paenibacillus mucilaginosus TaxID=61624 RepID=F8FFD0_PAEMK|nr:DUF445 domain-containing protein [Paenibacillus mucilaginosus]AEI41848.1 protein of unknown function DUF445 [Paenibacillus mucilaginosus KNP414]MCG7214528.1 DUF445 domain-containing protein [Paenibacillus mucilaginosus]WDM30808.1 DUF445 domain-containing protein [Paenibacillus mucilaginosus]WFA18981.1 DUF445 domain-containing protein [Paenibacillus mucilaginosus]